MVLRAASRPEVVLLDPVNEGLARDLEVAGGLGHVAAEPFERAPDELAFHLFEPHAFVRHRDGQVRAGRWRDASLMEVVARDRLTTAEQQDPLDLIFELAYVARPAVFEDVALRAFVEGGHRNTVLAAHVF